MRNLQHRYQHIIPWLVAVMLIGIGVAAIILKPDHAPETPISIPPVEERGTAIELTLPTVEILPPEEFVEIIDSCGATFEGGCVYGHMHIAGELMAVKPLRNGMILKVSERIVENGQGWYRVMFDEWIRYPDRLASELLIPESHARLFTATSSESLRSGIKATSTKRIVVDRSEQILRAYDRDVLFMEVTTSTGLDTTPTPRGTFTIYRKTPSRYMQGPLPGISKKEYDLPGVPWNLYFTNEGAVIHGAYWHDKFGQQWSNGCVNLPVATAERLYHWAEIGTTVVVQD